MRGDQVTGGPRCSVRALRRDPLSKAAAFLTARPGRSGSISPHHPVVPPQPPGAFRTPGAIGARTVRLCERPDARRGADVSPEHPRPQGDAVTPGS